MGGLMVCWMEDTVTIRNWDCDGLGEHHQQIGHMSYLGLQ